MKIVFNASNGFEAHILAGWLEQEGIRSYIDGEYLQGGIGELQAFGLVKVRVDDENYSVALAVVEAWEAQQSRSEPAMVEPSISTHQTRKTSGLRYAVALLVVFCGVLWFCYG